MLKKLTFKKIGISTLLLLLALILYNYPEEINAPINDVKCEYINIYLIDKNDFVAMTKIMINDDEDDQISYILNSLIIDSNKDIPKGFKATIPSGTKILGYQLDGELLKINFSKEFLNGEIKNYEIMIESIIYSLTSIKGVKKIMLFVEGEKLDKIPNSNINLGLYLDRTFGINKVVDVTDFHDVSMTTVYYVRNDIDKYYVPISYISNDNSDKVEIIIESLKTNRLNSSKLSSHLDYQVELMNYETSNENIILDFNEILLDSLENGKLKEEVKYAISYSIYDTLGVENVIFLVNSNKIDEFRLEMWLNLLYNQFVPWVMSS